MKWLTVWVLCLFSICQPSVGAEGDGYVQEFVIGLSSSPDSLDPQLEYSGPTYTYAAHCFQQLANLQSQGKVSYLLAEDSYWEDKLTLVLKLRKQVKFHDGSSFGARDVAYSIGRIRESPVSQFKHAVRNIKDVEVVDEHTIKITAISADTRLLNELSSVFIVPYRERFLSQAEMEQPQNLIGTGPYRFVGRDAGGDIHLEAFDGYFLPQPYLRKVRLHYDNDRQRRFADFKAGKIDFLEKLSPDEVNSLDNPGEFNFFKITSYRIIHLQMDTFRDKSPSIFTSDGKPSSVNPLKDKRVRRAVSLAIDRGFLVNNVLSKAGVASGQLVPEGTLGYVPRLAPDEYQPELARKLLAEAGYPKGFRMVLHGPNDRYFNDAKIAEAVAGMLGKVGITTTVETMPKSEYFLSMLQHDYSFMLLGFATVGQLDSMLNLLVRTPNEALKVGEYNLGRYSNPEVDALLQVAAEDQHELRRFRSLGLANELALADYALVPLYFEGAIWGSRKGFTYQPTPNEQTKAVQIFKY